MLGSKRFEKIIVLFTVMAVLFSLMAVAIPEYFLSGVKEAAVAEYPVKIFGKNIINVDITAKQSDWDEMLESKMSKPYIACDLSIDGHKFYNVGLRPKGNSSLTSIQNDRISYRVDFDHYTENQTCYGLEQMVFNNLQADATYMKDYIAYNLMTYKSINAPLHTYAFITLNGKPFGVYLAVEIYDEDYIKRVYNSTDVKLYSVKSSGMEAYESAVIDSDNAVVLEKRGMTENFGMGNPPGGGPPGTPPMPQDNFQDINSPKESAVQNAPPQIANMGYDFGEGMPQPPGGEGGGGDLVYTDDFTDSYSNIFGNAVEKNAKSEDFAKVMRAIKYLNKENVSNEELEKYWDVDSILRYLAVHSFMVNGDSYTGNMKQNYFLAEQNGKITVLPWDYNLSFGAFSGGPGGGPPGMHKGENDLEVKNEITEMDKTTEVINHAIDTPVFEIDMSSRPLVNVLLSREEYRSRYHTYLEELIQYVSGEFINKLEIIESEIYPYIERESIVFYSPQEHKIAFDVLKKFLNLRCQSIQAQLKGEISSETVNQEYNSLIKADFSIDEMGTMGDPGGGPNGFNENGMMPPGMPNGNGQGGPPPPNMPNGNEQGGPPPPNMQRMMNNQSNIDYCVTIIISLIMLGVMFFSAKMFKRNY